MLLELLLHFHQVHVDYPLHEFKAVPVHVRQVKAVDTSLHRVLAPSLALGAMVLHEMIAEQNLLADDELAVGLRQLAELGSAVRYGANDVALLGVVGQVERHVRILVHLLHVPVHIQVAVLILLYLYVKMVVIYMVLDQVVVVLQRGQAVLATGRVQQQVEEEAFVINVLEVTLFYVLHVEVELLLHFVVVGDQHAEVDLELVDVEAVFVGEVDVEVGRVRFFLFPDDVSDLDERLAVARQQEVVLRLLLD